MAWLSNFFALYAPDTVITEYRCSIPEIFRRRRRCRGPLALTCSAGFIPSCSRVRRGLYSAGCTSSRNVRLNQLLSPSFSSASMRNRSRGRRHPQLQRSVTSRDAADVSCDDLLTGMLACVRQLHFRCCREQALTRHRCRVTAGLRGICFLVAAPAGGQHRPGTAAESIGF